MSDTALSLAPATPPVTTPPAAPASNAAAPPVEAADKTENRRDNAKSDAPFLSALVQQMRAQSAATGDETTATTILAGDAALVSGAPADTKAPRTAPPDGTALPPGGQSLPMDPTVLALLSPLAAAVASATAVAAASSVRAAAAPGAELVANRNPVASAGPTATAPAASTAPTAPALLLAELAQYAPAPPNHTAVTTLEAATPSAVGLSNATASVQALPPVFTAVTASDSTMPTVPAAPAPIAIPVAQPGWDQALGQRVQWLLGQQMQGAELRINPPHLGPIEVRVSLGQDQQTTINFASPHGVVRDAIESALPRLRDMLGDQGMNQVNVNVSQHSFAEQRRQAGNSQGETHDAGYPGAPFDAPATERVATIESVMRHTAGLVDYFA